MSPTILQPGGRESVDPRPSRQAMTRALGHRPLDGRPRLDVVGVATTLLLLAFAFPALGQSLRGSPASLDRQDAGAERNDYTFIRTAKQLHRFVQEGWLVRVRPGQDLELHGASYPYARPELALFLRRLSAQYRAACGRKLVVTSLTRPMSRQPDNASKRSVHPTGMAADLRHSSSRTCRRWLEKVLLNLEGAHILEATRERYPPHYHVALFTQRYAQYVSRLQDEQSDETEQAVLVDASYKVRSGDSLWTIARSYGTTVTQLKEINGLSGSKIYAGQVLAVPAAR